MTLVQYIFSKHFLINLVLAIVLIAALIFGTLFFLDWKTNHGQQIEVPELYKMNLDQASAALEERGLNLTLEDTINYNPEFPPYSVLDYQPKAGTLVKEGRNIYVKLNPSGYAQIEVPYLRNKTRRQVEPTLRAAGFQIGNITYEPNIAEDMVLRLMHEGQEIKKGQTLSKTSIIDLVVGDKDLL